MQAIELTTPITNHQVTIRDAALPANAKQARVIVMWETDAPEQRHTPPPALAGAGTEHGDIIEWNKTT